MRGATGLGALSMQLTKARFASRQGESWLYLASILAFAVCSALALTVAGGTWMFVNRWQHPTGLLAEVQAADASYTTVLMFYVILACIACALLIPSMVGLAAAAAVLGARGREKRLSALRLLGLSSGDVTRMSLIDTLIQAGIGCAIGTLAYFATLPLWSALSMQAVQITPVEMTLPLGLLLAVLAATVLVGIVASWWGLRQVRISPLGVARRGSQPGLRAWRLVAFVAIIAAAFAVASFLPLGSSMLPWMVLGTILVTVIGGINLVAPWFLQLISGLLAKAPSASTMWAARRVQANPKAIWRQASGIAVLSFIGGYIAMMPIAISDNGASGAVRTFAEGAAWDFTRGALITLGVGLALTATSVLITQASAVLERAEQARALTRMGAPAGYLVKVTWIETLGPLLVALVLGAGLGSTLAMPMAKVANSLGQSATTGPAVLGSVMVAGIILVMGALVATHPLQLQVLRVQERARD